MGKRKKSKLHQAAHIKTHTEGTSNEISFSILDAAKKEADGAKGKNVSRGLFGNFPLFTFGRKKAVNTPSKEQEIALPGNDAAPAMPSSRSERAVAVSTQEVAQRKARRKRRRRLSVAFATTLVLAAFAGVGYFLYQEFSSHSDSLSLLNESLKEFEQADEIILEMDDLIKASVTATDPESISQVKSQFTQAQELLDRAEDHANQANEGMRDSADKEASNQALLSIEARRDLLSLGEQLLDQDVIAKEALDGINSAWADLVQANMLAHEAADIIADTTEENVQASQQKTQEAKETLEQARRNYEAVKQLYTDVDIELQLQYIDKRLESFEYAIASNEAILIQDKKTAETQNEAYNLAESEAAALAEDFPPSPTKPVLDVYETLTKDTRDQYVQARTKAAVSDAFLRDYLGTSAK